jgi:hypothetical protein
MSIPLGLNPGRYRHGFPGVAFARADAPASQRTAWSGLCGARGASAIRADGHAMRGSYIRATAPTDTQAGVRTTEANDSLGPRLWAAFASHGRALGVLRGSVTRPRGAAQAGDGERAAKCVHTFYRTNESLLRSLYSALRAPLPDRLALRKMHQWPPAEPGGHAKRLPSAVVPRLGCARAPQRPRSPAVENLFARPNDARGHFQRGEFQNGQRCCCHQSAPRARVRTCLHTRFDDRADHWRSSGRGRDHAQYGVGRISGWRAHPHNQDGRG